MSHPLKRRLAQIRRRIRQVLFLYGISWVLAVTISALLLVGFLDWLLHLDDPGVRLILGLSITVATLGVAWRFLIAPLRTRFDDLDLALRVEERYPELRDSLASTVEFVERGFDPGMGSPALQRRVIERTTQRVETIEFGDVVQTRSVRRIAAVAIGVCLTAGLVIGFNQLEAATALRRLAFPFSATPWPRSTELRLVNSQLEALESSPEEPLRVARGDTLELYVINTKGNGRLPSRLAIQYRMEDGAVLTEPMSRGSLRDHAGQVREVGVANLTVKAPLHFRAIGGDDESMPWYPLDVVPPPVVESLQITLVPPAYTGRAAEKLPPGVGHVEGLVGTRVQVSGRTNKPLGNATLRLKDQEKLPVTVEEDGRSLVCEFTIHEPGVYSYWLDLRDRLGFENSDAPRYEVRALQDTVPEIYIDHPTGNLQVTPQAVLPLRTVAEDDLGLREIRLQYRDAAAAEFSSATLPLFDGEGRPKQRTVEYEWSLAEIPLLQQAASPGAGRRQIVFYTEALDDFDLGEPHVGRSTDRILTIVTAEEKLQELADRQAAMLSDLERVARTQVEAHSQVEELQLQLRTAGELRPEDLDLLQRIELQQRQVGRELQDADEGLAARHRRLLEELENNRLNDPTTRMRLEQIAGELERLGRENLPIIEQELTQARKDLRIARSPDDELDAFSPAGGARDASPSSSEGARGGEDRANQQETKSPGSAAGEASPGTKAPKRPASKDQKGEGRPTTPPGGVEQALARAAENQAAVRDSLQDLLNELSQWRDQRGVSRDLEEIIAQQQEIMTETGEKARQTLTRRLQDLSAQERADLARLAQRQQGQADRLDELVRRMDELLKQPEATNSASGEAMRDARDQAVDTGVASQLGEAARQIAGNNIARGVQSQQQALDQLRELEDILRNRAETNTEALVKKLRQAESELEELKQQQQELLRKTEEAAQISNPAERERQLEALRKEQQEVEQRVSQVARRLRRLQADQPSRSAQRATNRMREADQSLEGGVADQAQTQQQEALDDLEQAQRELAAKRQQAEEQLAREQLERIADELEAMIARQQTVIDETARLEAARAERGNWTRGQLRSLRDLAEVERGLQQETEQIVEMLAPAKAFSMALTRAADQMRVTADKLASRETGPETQQSAQSARDWFRRMMEALADDPTKPSAEQGPMQAGGGEGDSGGPQTDGIPQLAELKMLKFLQLELNDRTTRLALKRERQGQLSPAEQEELQTLAREQGELADLVRNLAAAVTPRDGAEKASEGEPTESGGRSRREQGE